MTENDNNGNKQLESKSREKKQHTQAGPGMQAPGPKFSLWRLILIAVAAFALFQLIYGTTTPQTEIDYTSFREHVKQGKVKKVLITGSQIEGELKQPATMAVNGRTNTYTEFKTHLPARVRDPLLENMEQQNVAIEARPERDFSWWYILFLLSPLLIIGLLVYMQYQRIKGAMGGHGGGLFNIGKSRAKRYEKQQEQTTFDNVAGAEGPKKELQEIVSFLREPERILELGGKVPRGLLLLGPPGCGKTLLARAVAGEADVPFFSITGSDFMEMFVGVGASRVRNLFNDAKQSAPSIVFVDELDSIGRRRGAGLGGGHDEREQTLNQLLSEMDGFEPNESVIVVAATNRPDILDPALQRPGRFDRQVIISNPNRNERGQILEIYAKNKPISRDVDLDQLARSTPGFSGADLENLLNEAALLAGRKQKKQIEQDDVDEARDKILMGLVRQGLSMSEEEKRMVAYHEAGHAVTSVLLPGANPIHKVSIIPRSRAMGVTERFPEEERYIYAEDYMYNQLSVMMGGRAAEELVFEMNTTGAENDLKQATKLARRMVLSWGMSEEFRNIALGTEQEEVFLGRQIAQQRDYSEQTAREVDEAVKKILREAYQRTTKTLKENREALKKVVDQLMEREEIPGSELTDIINEVTQNKQTE
jgi:cell division protease FtsH